jgi:soluble lytic murein transglycosylase
MRMLKSATLRYALLAAGLTAALAASAAFDPGVARLGQAITAYDKHDFFTTVHLLTAGGQPDKLRDYVTYYLSNAELMTNNGDAAVRDLGHYLGNPVPASPLAGRLGLLYAKALLTQSHATPATAAKARQILETESSLLPQPEGDFALAQAYEATGFPREAVVFYQRVYYMHPASDLADKAKTAEEKLQPALGTEYPAATPRQRLDRANAWLKTKQYVRARQEFAVLAGELTGADRDEAQSGVGAALYLNGDAAGAMNYLAPLHPEGAVAAAERLYYLTEAYRRLNDDSAMLNAVHQLNEHYPVSPWRLKALITAGNRYLLTQDRAQYIPLYQAVAETFPIDPSAALCHWRVVWAAWLDHSPRRVDLLKEQVEKFPNDTRVSDALFFLGRAAEQDSDLAAAKAYYERLDDHYPHYYYAGLARTRLAEPKLAAAKPDPALRKWLEQTGDVHTGAIPSDMTALPNQATRQRIERGRLLIAAGLTTQAVDELEFGAKQSAEQPTLLAMELSRAMPTPYLAVRVMKKFSGDYLSLPFEKASRAFWEMLFPLPYQETLTARATERDLDPYAVAGLIRQESEFNPGARSAVAYGLMQLIPSTGRSLGRSAGIRVGSAGMLLDPGLNIRLGTQYLRGQLNQWEGDWVKTLAAYNAGPSRVRDWLQQYGYSDSAEFIENIPFSETRDYVQAVLRNGQVYRELYGRQKAALALDAVDDSDVPPAKITNVAAVSKVVVKKPLRLAAPNKASARNAPAKNAQAKKAPAKSTKAAKTASAAKAGKPTTGKTSAAASTRKSGGKTPVADKKSAVASSRQKRAAA